MLNFGNGDDGRTAFLGRRQVPLVLSPHPGLGQAVGPAMPAGPQPAAPSVPPSPPPPPPPPSPFTRCPGPIEMPDGRVIEPDDPITLNDLCELLPFLVSSAAEAAAKAAPGISAGQPVPLAPPPGIPGAGPGVGPAGPVPISPPGGPLRGAGFPSFGPASGGFGGGPSGPTGPSQLGVINGPTPPPTPPPPPPAPPFGVDFKVKTDGDFIAGPGAFVPVPGTDVSFTLPTAGAVLFLLRATLGSSTGGVALSQSGQLGIRVDGVDYPLTPRLLHTFTSGVGEFLVGQDQAFVLNLSEGSHTAEILLRGLLPGEFGAGIGTPASVAAVPNIPLALIVIHG
jgi:hypothetical protein